MRIDNMVDDDFFLREFDAFRFLETEAGIVVAEHCRHRGDEFQFQNEGRITDVARVQNMIHPREDFFHAGIKKSVGVGNDPDFHTFASSGLDSVSGSGSRAPAALSAGDSAAIFSAPTKSAVKMPVLKSVLRKNSHVDG